MTVKKKKSAKEKRVLIASLIVAGVIVAGSTFAWFTSKDEVTNRLSASANYNVAIGETFQPPTNMAPGQAVNKDVVAVNTGDVDAFVRMWFDGNMRFLEQNTAGNANKAKYDTDDGFTLPNTETTEATLINLGLKYIDDEGNLYKTLSKTQATAEDATVTPGTFSEVQAMQSGILAYAPDNAKYCYVLQQATKLKVYDKNADEYVEGLVPAKTLVCVGFGNDDYKSEVDTVTGEVTPNNTSVEITSVSGAVKTYSDGVVSVEAPSLTDGAFAPQNIEFESFVPMTQGLYLFLRNEADATQDDPEFSGYYMTADADNAADGDVDAFKGVEFFALNTDAAGNNRSEYTVKGAETASATAPVQVIRGISGSDANYIIGVKPSANLELYTAKYDVNAVPADPNAWAWSFDATTMILKGEFDVDPVTGTDEKAVVEIQLANVGNGEKEWTRIDGEKPTFYYNDDVAAGGNSSKLVDSVKVYTDGQNGVKFLSFDFDLNVHLESIQVAKDDKGNDLATPVEGTDGWAVTSADEGNVAAKGTITAPTGENQDIEKITWTKIT